jgi:hypothetical protein
MPRLRPKQIRVLVAAGLAVLMPLLAMLGVAAVILLMNALAGD